MSLYKPYNPNPSRNRVGDCTVRAICKATGQEWNKVFCALSAYGLACKDMPSANSVWGKYLRELGFRRYLIEDDRFDYTVGSSYRRGYSRDGGYSEAKGDYMDAKHSYRTTRSAESKRDMDVSLQECMHKLKKELDEMEANADTREEREKIREMRREIGNLA